jgi:hypothetical protein
MALRLAAGSLKSQGLHRIGIGAGRASSAALRLPSASWGCHTCTHGWAAARATVGVDRRLGVVIQLPTGTKHRAPCLFRSREPELRSSLVSLFLVARSDAGEAATWRAGEVWRVAPRGFTLGNTLIMSELYGQRLHHSGVLSNQPALQSSKPDSVQDTCGPPSAMAARLPGHTSGRLRQFSAVPP